MRWINHTLFSLVEHGSVRILDALTTLILIRILAAEEFGLFSVYQSWVAALLIFFPTIEVALFREYALLKQEGRLSDELGVYRFFSYLKLLALCVVVFCLSFLPKNIDWFTRFVFLGFAFFLPFSQSFYGFMREPLRFEMQQHKVAFFSMLQRLLLISAFLLGWWAFPKQASLTIALALLTYFLAGFLWTLASWRYLRSSPVVPSQALSKIGRTLYHVVLWIHVSGVLTQTIQTLDIFALNWFRTDLSEIGLYGIALKAAVFFQIIPLALVSTFGVFLSKKLVEQRGGEKKQVLLYNAFFILLCLLLFAVGLFFAQPLLQFLAQGKLATGGLEQTVYYFKYQLAGVLIFCSVFPMSTYLGIRASLKNLFVFISLPWFVLSAALYFWAATYGPLLAAKMNVLVYAIHAILVVIYYFFEASLDSSALLRTKYFKTLLRFAVPNKFRRSS